MEKIYDVLIIGGGPAGMTAAIYAKRGGLDVAIIEKGATGGLASTAARVENYPGVPPKSGFDICYEMFSQCEALGVEFIFDSAVGAELKGETKRIELGSGDSAFAKNIIIAGGAAPKRLGVADEERLTGRGISYCATCDGALYKGKDAAVIGGGNTACEDALYLEKLARRVYLIHRRDALRADNIVAQRVLQSGVTMVWDSVVTALGGHDKLNELTVKNVKTGSLSVISVDCAFVAIGQSPCSDIYAPLKKDPSGYIETDAQMRTNIPGVYAAGDIRSKSLRQIVTACADGAIAADCIIKNL